MNIVFCTTCKGRLEHLKQTLPRNLSDNATFAKCKFVVLDYGSDDGLGEYLREVYDQPTTNLAVYRYETKEPFHVSHAKNMAGRCGILEGADILVTLDADNFTGPGFAKFIAEKFTGERGTFLCPDFPLIKRLGLRHMDGGPLARGFAGRFAVRAQDFIKVGGYDEEFHTWRGEDMDMIARLGRIGYAMRHIHPRFLTAVPHGAAVRFKEYPEAQQYENDGELAAINARTETVANFGNFGVGTVYRNFDFTKPIELGPVPTRIFGIGMQKTGTTSLHAALEILGFDSFHWGRGEAPRIWNEMNSFGRSNTLEQWYALSDNPIPVIYQKLDRAYPGSKFILTVRDEQDWLKSVERLWDPKYNATRWVWDTYPFTNRIHTAMYGRKDFDAPTFLARYRRHNAEVAEYFKARPGDLLTLDMDELDDQWPVLCGFLRVPVPDAPYPIANRTRDREANREYARWASSGGDY